MRLDMSATPAQIALRTLLELGYGEGELPPIAVEPSSGVLPSIYRVDDVAAATIAATHAAAAIELRARDGIDRDVTIDTREAAIAFRSERYLRVDGQSAGDPWAPLSGDYRARNGRWIRLHCNFPHHADAVLRALRAANDREAVARAVAERDAIELEEDVLAQGGAAAAQRSISEWEAHAHARELARAQLVELRRIGEGKPHATRVGALPLDGVRALDLTRVIAGPVAGRTLAAYGADVLRIGAQHLPTIPTLVIDTGFGKRFADIDLRASEGRERLRSLIGEADAFIQAYRPGAIAHLGFSPEEVAAIHPGIIYVSLSAYGRGEWSDRRGFDSLVQMATGITYRGAVRAHSDAPVPLPAQALDHATGWLAALGTLAALHRRRREGGSWHVEVSLARTAEWLKSLGEVDRLDAHDPTIDDVRDLLRDDASPFGNITHVRFPGQIDDLDLQWRTPPHPQGADYGFAHGL
jgi:crotonobetainyl-CoA:carnitine CoA-transferase CaiB-like acyl-CoA transferase